MVVGGRFENTQRGGKRKNAQELSQKLVEEGDNEIKIMQGASGMVS